MVINSLNNAPPPVLNNVLEPLHESCQLHLAPGVTAETFMQKADEMADELGVSNQSVETIKRVIIPFLICQEFQRQVVVCHDTDTVRAVIARGRDSEIRA